MQSEAKNMEEVQKAQWQESDFVVCKQQGNKVRIFAHLYGILAFTCFFLANCLMLVMCVLLGFNCSLTGRSDAVECNWNGLPFDKKKLTKILRL